MSAKGKAGKDRSQAAAWAWHQRGVNSAWQQGGGAALTLSGRSRHQHLHERALEIRAACRQRPSRFKQEAAALLPRAPPALHDHAAEAINSPLQARSSAAHYVRHAPHDHVRHALHDHPHHAAAAHLQENQMIGFTDQGFQHTFPAACRICPSPPQSGQDHSDLEAPVPRRRSESLPPTDDRCWVDNLSGITGRKSVSSGADLVRGDRDLKSLILPFSCFSNQLNSPAAAAAPSSRTSSLFDSFELQAILKKLGYEAHDYDLAAHQPALRLSVGETALDSPILQYLHQDSPPPARCRQTLYDLLRWSDRSSDKKGCSFGEQEECISDDYYYNSGSPEINCSSNNCSPKVEVRRHRRRPSILMPHLPHSFSNALHHLPHLPRSFSNALHLITHITHSLSAVYRHHVTSSHRQNGIGVAVVTMSHHHYDADNGRAASPISHPDARTHRYRIPFHLRHLFSFKTYHPPYPSCSVVFDSTSPAADCRDMAAVDALATPVYDHLKSSPSVDQHVSTSDDYVQIYSSAEKICDHKVVHHHHHYHHHFHYISSNEAG